MAEIRFVAEVPPELADVLVDRVEAAVRGLAAEVICSHPDPFAKTREEQKFCELEIGHDGRMCRNGDHSWENPKASWLPRNRRMEIGCFVVRRSDDTRFEITVINDPWVDLENGEETVTENYNGEFWAKYQAEARVPEPPTIRIE